MQNSKEIRCLVVDRKNIYWQSTILAFIFGLIFLSMPIAAFPSESRNPFPEDVLGHYLKDRLLSLSYLEMRDLQIVALEGIIGGLTEDEVPKQTQKTVDELHSQQVKELASQLRPNKNILLIFGNVGGGRVGFYRDLFEELRRVCSKGKCGITTYVNASCASACVETFMRGDEKVIHPDAIFGFHEYYNPNGIFGKYSTKRELADLYVKLGGNREWFRSHIDFLVSSQARLAWISARQALSAQIADRVDNQLISSLPQEFTRVLPSRFGYLLNGPISLTGQEPFLP